MSQHHVNGCWVPWGRMVPIYVISSTMPSRALHLFPTRWSRQAICGYILGGGQLGGQGIDNVCPPSLPACIQLSEPLVFTFFPRYGKLFCQLMMCMISVGPSSYHAVCLALLRSVLMVRHICCCDCRSCYFTRFHAEPCGYNIFIQRLTSIRRPFAQVGFVAECLVARQTHAFYMLLCTRCRRCVSALQRPGSPALAALRLWRILSAREAAAARHLPPRFPPHAKCRTRKRPCS